jgi:hypothetical protein
MNEILEKNNSITFFELLKSEDRIEIPIIQRDYAQGREDKKEIRDDFLNAIYENLVNNTHLKLDFIYGNKIDKTFQPLDGQQRLTTLFLLHWYASIKEMKIVDCRAELKKFSYETRITSREFCEALINCEAYDINKSISNQIIDSKWFFLSWKNDPTIDAMLRTIDAINLKFNKIENLWEKLTVENLISFYNIELKNIGLTDDLYIKMNARGKLLTPFENFKASFEKQILDLKWEEEVIPTETFAFKIDTVWTDFFWTEFRKNNKIDISLMRFISTLLMYRIAIEKGNNRIQLISNIHENQNNLKSQFITKDSYSYIYNTFELYSKKYSITDFNFNINFFRHNPKLNFLSEVTFEENLFSTQINSASYTQKVLLFAQTEYLLKNPEINKEMFSDWMRVVRNIVSRGSIERGGKRNDIIRSPETFDGVISLILELSEGCNDIYNYLSNKERLNSSFAKEQIEEEKNKAKIIVEFPEFKNEIFEMEDLILFKGRIDFAFYCIDYDYNVENFNKNDFINVKNVIKEHLNDDSKDDISNDLRRILLTIEIDGNYNFYDYWWSYWYVGDATKRCLIENFRELEYIIYNTDFRNFIKALVNKLKNQTINEILSNFEPPENMPNWKIRLISESNLLDVKSKSNYIAINETENICYLLRSKRPRDIEGCEEIR